jgi:ATP-dependent HslUV protease ATP-binding subunit HslU
LSELTPREIVESLDRYIVGQEDAKRAVAIAIRNRWRRQQLPEEIRADVTPKNIIMIGPTGVGKTEIARRLATLIQAPFVKVEATKYTEVGYHGRDVESMVRDLVEAGIRLVREGERRKVQEDAQKKTRERLLDLLLPHAAESSESTDEEKRSSSDSVVTAGGLSHTEEAMLKADRHRRVRQRLAEKLDAGELEDRLVSLKVEQRTSPVQVFSNVGMEQMDADLQNMLERFVPRAAKHRELTVAQARKVLLEQEVENLIDKDVVHEKAIELAEQSGIIFIDEIDKIAGPAASQGPDVSRQGVQRDLLPVVEGTTVPTRYGPVRTEHVLFIAAGAFHVTKPSDLMPELQGRFPIRVELGDLTQIDFVRILKEPRHSLVRQYTEMLATEGLQVTITEDAIDVLAEFAHRINRTTQNIGARRLQTLLEKTLEEPSYLASDQAGQKLVVNADYVRDRLEAISLDEDLSRYIL